MAVLKIIIDPHSPPASSHKRSSTVLDIKQTKYVVMSSRPKVRRGFLSVPKICLRELYNFRSSSFWKIVDLKSAGSFPILRRLNALSSSLPTPQLPVFYILHSTLYISGPIKSTSNSAPSIANTFPACHSSRQATRKTHTGRENARSL